MQTEPCITLPNNVYDLFPNFAFIEVPNNQLQLGYNKQCGLLKSKLLNCWSKFYDFIKMLSDFQNSFTHSIHNSIRHYIPQCLKLFATFYTL